MEILYNGIVLDEVWPPNRAVSAFNTPMSVPYLDNPPAVIPIDVGRQLFVDDFLIDATTMRRTFHQAQGHPNNPILRPQEPTEWLEDVEGARGVRPVAAVFSDGVFYDPNEQRFKMWYHAGWFNGTAYATSRNGLVWERPRLDVGFFTQSVYGDPYRLMWRIPYTNQIQPTRFKEGHHRDGSCVWLDHEASDPLQRYKMLIFNRKLILKTGTEPADKYLFEADIHVSADGIHWSDPMLTSINPGGDNCTFFYNPFRKKWVYSIRSYETGVRLRSYREHDDFILGSRWGDNAVVFWTRADDQDDRNHAYGGGVDPQLYKLDATPYESLMLGVFTIYQGPNNATCEAEGRPKLTELMLGFSRDGFHWHRPYRQPFIAATKGGEEDWNRAYLHSAGGGCLVVGGKLYFYHGGWSGKSGDPAATNAHKVYAGGSTGVAFLRRDGFASMDAGDSVETLTTRPVLFGGRYLFVNVDSTGGEFYAELLMEDRQPIEPFTLARSTPIQDDGTLVQMRWGTESDIGRLAGRPVRFRFHLRHGKLYSFWVSPDESGASRGYVAAGGPGFPGAVDTVGIQANHEAERLRE